MDSQNLESDSSNAPMSKTGGLSGRYARALFELAKEVEKENAAQITAQIATLQTILAQGGDMQKLIANPLISKEEQKAAFMGILKEIGAEDLLKNFIQFLIAKGRLAQLPAILRDYDSLSAQDRNEMTAYIIAASDLGAAHKATLTDILTRALGKSVRLKSEIDPSLLGGFVLKIGSRMIDGSLARKLQSLQTKMNHAN